MTSPAHGSGATPSKRPDPSQDFTYARILRRINPFIRAVLCSSLHRLLSGRMMLVDFKGRRSGRDFSIPVGYAKIDDEFIVLISKPSTRFWWRNFREAWPATLTIRRARQPAEGVVVKPGSAPFRRCFEETFRLHADTCRIYGVDFDAERGLTETQLETLSQERGAVRFKPTSKDGAS